MQDKTVVNRSTLPQLAIDFNDGWELQNWYVASTKKSDYGLPGGDDIWLRDIPKVAVQMAQNAHDKEEGLRLMRPILDEFINTYDAKKIIEDSINRANKAWENCEGKFFPALSAMLDVPMEKFEKEYHAHLTFTRRCPFYKNEFMFSRFGNIENTATHEIMHIEFLKAYESYCKERGLADSEIQHLKEILTVLLDEDNVISKLRSKRDQGYTKHEKIREEVAALYKKHKSENPSFTEFLNQVIDLVKSAGF